MNPKLLLFQWLVLMAVPLLIWLIPVMRKYLMPLVMIQISWGFILGPSLLGKTHPELFRALFPADSIPAISTVGFFAVVFFVFLTGMHLDIHQLSGRGQAHKHRTSVHHIAQFWTISLTSLLVPLLLGCCVAYALWFQYPTLHGSRGGISVFVFSLGLAAGVTALPVLAAILVETGRINSRIGKFVLSCSTVHDGLLWIMLTGLLAMTGAGHGHGGPMMTVALTALYICFMVMVARPAMARFIRTEYWRTTPDFAKLTIEAMCLALSAIATEYIGIHYLLGAVLFGAMLPPEVRKPLIKRVEFLIVAVFLPFFFGSAGLKVSFEVGSSEVWIVAGLMTSIVMIGQLLGTSLIAKYAFKNTWPESLEMGAYMASKGIVEIVILGIMLQAQFISDVTYAGMIITAVVCTALTKPIVFLIHRYRAPVPHEDEHHVNDRELAPMEAAVQE